jgi:hypothetical protein
MSDELEYLFKTGNADEILKKFDTSLEGLNNELSLEHGPLPLNQYTIDFQSIIVQLIENPESVEFKWDGEYKAIINGKTINLSEILLKMDARFFTIPEEVLKKHENANPDATKGLPDPTKTIDEKTKKPSMTPEEYQTLYGKLGGVEKQAIYNYTTPKYALMNGVLRAQTPPIDSEAGKIDPKSENFNAAFKQTLLDSALALSGLSKIPDETIATTFRYETMPDDRKQKIDASIGKESGVVFESQFVSTSAEGVVARGEQKIMFRDMIGKNVRGLTAFPHEREYLMPPTQVRFEKSQEEKDDHGKTITYYIAKPVYTLSGLSNEAKKMGVTEEELRATIEKFQQLRDTYQNSPERAQQFFWSRIKNDKKIKSSSKAIESSALSPREKYLALRDSIDLMSRKLNSAEKAQAQQPQAQQPQAQQPQAQQPQAQQPQAQQPQAQQPQAQQPQAQQPQAQQPQAQQPQAQQPQAQQPQAVKNILSELISSERTYLQQLEDFFATKILVDNALQNTSLNVEERKTLIEFREHLLVVNKLIENQKTLLEQFENVIPKDFDIKKFDPSHLIEPFRAYESQVEELNALYKMRGYNITPLSSTTNKGLADKIGITNFLSTKQPSQLADYVIMPIQRSPRYLLLLGEIKKTYPDKSQELGQAMRIAGSIAEKINNADTSKALEVQLEREQKPHLQKYIEQKLELQPLDERATDEIKNERQSIIDTERDRVLKNIQEMAEIKNTTLKEMKGSTYLEAAKNLQNNLYFQNLDLKKPHLMKDQEWALMEFNNLHKIAKENKGNSFLRKAGLTNRVKTADRILEVKSGKSSELTEKFKEGCELLKQGVGKWHEPEYMNVLANLSSLIRLGEMGAATKHDLNEIKKSYNELKPPLQEHIKRQAAVLENPDKHGFRDIQEAGNSLSNLQNAMNSCPRLVPLQDRIHIEIQQILVATPKSPYKKGLEITKFMNTVDSLNSNKKDEKLQTEMYAYLSSGYKEIRIEAARTLSELSVDLSPDQLKKAEQSIQESANKLPLNDPSRASMLETQKKISDAIINKSGLSDPMKALCIHLKETNRNFPSLYEISAMREKFDQKNPGFDGKIIRNDMDYLHQAIREAELASKAWGHLEKSMAELMSHGPIDALNDIQKAERAMALETFNQALTSYVDHALNCQQMWHFSGIDNNKALQSEIGSTLGLKDQKDDWLKAIKSRKIDDLIPGLNYSPNSPVKAFTAQLMKDPLGKTNELNTFLNNSTGFYASKNNQDNAFNAIKDEGFFDKVKRFFGFKHTHVADLQLVPLENDMAAKPLVVGTVEVPSEPKTLRSETKNPSITTSLDSAKKIAAEKNEVKPVETPKVEPKIEPEPPPTMTSHKPK